MVRAVRAGQSLRDVAAAFGVSVGTVFAGVERARGKRIDRVRFTNSKPGRAWNRTPSDLEQRILRVRTALREHSVLGEYGPDAIGLALQENGSLQIPARVTIYRVLARHGVLDGAHRQRRPAPPKGWYLPNLASGQAELDSFDFIEDLKIAGGPLVSVHRFADSVGRISRLCLALQVIPVFAPPREPGFQNAIEGFNGLWQSKVWQRHHCDDIASLAAVSARYITAYRAKTAPRREVAPTRRRIPARFTLDLGAPLRGTIIYVRRSNENGDVQLLGKAFSVDEHWLHRLVRCEVDFTHQRIRFYALRRRDPARQPLLRELPYPRPNKPFHGTP